MGKNISVDCRRVNQSSEFLKRKEEEFNTIRKDMEKLSMEMKDIWKGNDASAFFAKFDSYIEHLKSVSVFLNEKSLLFDKASKLHGQIDYSLEDRVKRRDVDGKNSTNF